MLVVVNHGTGTIEGMRPSFVRQLLNHLFVNASLADIGQRIYQILKGAIFEWNEDKVPRMAAAIAFYAVFSLTPIVVIAFKLGEAAFGTDIALREILTQAAFLIGNDGADGIKLLIENCAATAS